VDREREREQGASTFNSLKEHVMLSISALRRRANLHGYGIESRDGRESRCHWRIFDRWNNTIVWSDLGSDELAEVVANLNRPEWRWPPR
jgi:hypothetical protein